MDLIINRMAIVRSSLGVRRAFNAIMQHLAWDSDVIYPKLPQSGPTARVAELLQRGRRDAIYWTPTHRGPLWAHHHVVTVHDCINVDYVYRTDWRLPLFRRLFNKILINAQVVVAVSRATKDALLRNYAIDESRVRVIPLGFDLPSQNFAPATDRSSRPFILMLTNALPHKNAMSACRAFMQSHAPREGFILRVIGSLPAAASEFCAGNAGKIEVHTSVTDEVLHDWYRSAAFLFGPSLAEGYDLPVAEAIANGGNVLCSDIPVHREFFEGRVAFFDASREDAMVTALNAALSRTGTCWYPRAASDRLRLWKDVADDYRALFHSIEPRRVR